MWALLKRGPLADLSISKDQKPGDLGRNLEVYWRQQKELKPRVRKESLRIN